MLRTASSPSEIVFVIGADYQAGAAAAGVAPTFGLGAAAWPQAMAQHARDLLTEIEYGPAIIMAIAKTQTLLEADSASLCLIENGAGAVQYLLEGEQDAAGAERISPDSSYPFLPENGVIHRRGACTTCRLRAAWCASAPLYSEGKQIGMLCAMRNTLRARFQPEQIHVLQLLAFWAAIAIGNARKVRAVQEQARSERERIAAHLHDHTAQSLSAIGLKVEQAAAALGPAAPVAVRQDLLAVKAISEQLTAQVRAAFGDLRQSPAQPGNLVTALASCIDAFTQATRLPVEFTVTGACALPVEFSSTGTCALSVTVQAQATQIVREALNNVARHARASRVQVKLMGDRRAVRIVVQDNGVGFDLHAVGADQRHLGTLLMRERAERSGGALTIESRPGHGTQVTLVYPAANQP